MKLSFVFLFIISGIILTVAGFNLLTLGGASYYFITGLAITYNGILLYINKSLSIWVFLLVVVYTMFWSILEIGLDLWQLLPRLSIFIFFSIIFIFPSIKKQLSLNKTEVYTSKFIILLPVSLLVLSIPKAQYYPIISSYRAAGTGDIPVKWTHFGGDTYGTRFSPIDQINRNNVGELEHAWTFSTNEDLETQYTFQSTPIEIDGDLFFCSPTNRVFSINGDTGKLNWSYDPKVIREHVPFFVCRGVSYHYAEDDIKFCKHRLLMGTVDDRLIALDAKTGKVCEEFAENGEVDLSEGLGDVTPGHHFVSSPVTVINNIAVVGSFILDNQSNSSPPGVVRAYDVLSGELVWAWDLLGDKAHPPLNAGESYPKNTANVWSVGSADPELGLIYLPTGNTPPDFFGGMRSAEQELYPSSVVALEANTGNVRWSFQTVRHDIWDYDVGAQPVLIDYPLDDGTTVPAVVVATKWGELFVLDRKTGKPIVDIIEKPVPQNPVKGEWLSKTQPFSDGFPSFVPPELNEETMWGSTIFDQLWCRIKFKAMRYDGLFTPPSLEGTIQYPGIFGVIDWGSVSMDLERQLMIVNTSRMPHKVKLRHREEMDRLGVSVYGEGDGNNGHGEVDNIGLPFAMAGTPYGLSMDPLLSPLGFPCNSPPWGHLSAIDMKTKSIIWQRPLGTTHGHAPFGLAFPTGVFNIGGTATTRGGLTFIAGTIDNFLRAFDSETGEQLWQGELPAGGQSGPMTFVSPTTGIQYVVIAAGGHISMGTDLGDSVVAFKIKNNNN